MNLQLVEAIKAAAGSWVPGKGKYVRRSDSYHCFLADGPNVSIQVDRTLTIHRSTETGEIIGYTIHGVSTLAED